MKTITFHSGDYAPESTYLFNDRKHLYLQAEQDWKCFYILDQKKTCLAFIWLHFEKNIASSPLRAPFGSFEFAKDLSLKTLYDFLLFIESALKSSGIYKITIKNFPDAYNPAKATLLVVLLQNAGYSISHAEVSSVIQVNNSPYTDHVNDWEIRKIKQAKAEGLFFAKHTIESLTNIYTFLEQCRTEKGYRLSLTLSQLTALSNAFPETILLFSIGKQNEIASACIAIRVSEDVLYTFYYDHTVAFHAYSPVAMLMAGMYVYCQENSIRLLDLGTASLDGQPNFGLLDFKRHLGGIPSAKLTFEKLLD